MIIALSASCNHSEAPVYSPYRDSEAAECISIAYLQTLGRGESHTLNSSCYIEGWVVANDLYGEYSQALVVEDASGGIEVEVAGRELYRTYPLGLPLRIYCEGLALGDYGGKLILGAPPTGEYVTDRIAVEEQSRYLRPLNDQPQRPTSQPLQIGEERRALIGCYVHYTGVRIQEASEGLRWCEIDPLSGAYRATTRHLEDATGKVLELYCAAGCSYAAEPLPEGELHCYGILDYFNGHYQLRLVNRGFLSVEK